VQARRRRSDRQLAGLLTPRFDQAALPLPVGGQLLNALLTAYWRGIRSLL
jgi:hypothetical protein